MKKILSVLIEKKFSVMVGGEFERNCDFLGFMQVLSNYGDFFQYSSNEKKQFLSKLLKEREVGVDMNISVKFN